MSQPSLSILSLANKLREQMHSRNYAMNHVLAHARALGYPRAQARNIVIAVYNPEKETWRSIG